MGLSPAAQQQSDGATSRRLPVFVTLILKLPVEINPLEGDLRARGNDSRAWQFGRCGFHILHGWLECCADPKREG